MEKINSFRESNLANANVDWNYWNFFFFFFLDPIKWYIKNYFNKLLKFGIFFLFFRTFWILNFRGISLYRYRTYGNRFNVSKYVENKFQIVLIEVILRLTAGNSRYADVMNRYFVLRLATGNRNRWFFFPRKKLWSGGKFKIVSREAAFSESEIYWTNLMK